MMTGSLVPYKEFTSKYVLEQYKNSPRLLGLINAVLTQCDDLEIALYEIFQALDLSSAMGPALDYIGVIVGPSRKPGETDEAYRGRIETSILLVGTANPEALRKMLLYVSGSKSVGLVPVWPACTYFILDGEASVDIDKLEGESCASGAALGRGTFLCGEPDDDALLFDCGYLVDEDHGQPIVCDYRVPDTLHELITDANEVLVNENNQELVALDYLTITPP